LAKLGYRRDYKQFLPKETFIKPSRGWVALNLSVVWRRRGLLYFLVWRDVKVRYKQTFLGAAWVILQPVSIMVIFSVVFGFLAKVPSDGIPYPVFTFCALVPWQLVANSFTDAGNSLAANQNLITKVYFPRVIIPLAAVLTRLIDFAFGLLVLVGILFYYDLRAGNSIWFLPFFILIALAIGLGLGLWLSQLCIRYRDVRHMIPFFTQLWFFASPIAYSVSLIPESWRLLYSINPMVGVIEGFRWALTGTGNLTGQILVISIVLAVFLLITGLYYFRRAERDVADVV
jgi:lipopolysaccharide transport system permease protein